MSNRDLESKEEDLYYNLLHLNWEVISEDREVYFRVNYKNYIFTLHNRYMTIFDVVEEVSKDIVVNEVLYGQVYMENMPVVQPEYIEELCSIFGSDEEVEN